MSVEHASLTRKPFRPRRAASAAWAQSKRAAVNRNAPSSPRSRPRASLGWILGRRTYWAGFDGILPSMWARRSTRRWGKAAVDGRGGQAGGLQGTHVQLDLRAGGLQDIEPGVGRPLEEPTQVGPVGIKGPAPVAGQERSSRQLGLIDDIVDLE